MGGSFPLAVALLASLASASGCAVSPHVRCERGSGAECVAAGLMLERGSAGTSVPPVDAQWCYQRACELGSMEGCVRYGRALPPDQQARAQLAFQRACDASEPAGCYGLGQLHDRANASTADRVIARTYYLKACRAGFPLGCHGLANLLDRSEADATNQELAEVSRARACDLGVADDCAQLGEKLLSDPKAEKDRAFGVRFLQQGCDDGSWRACRLLRARGIQSRVAGPGGPDEVQGEVVFGASASSFTDQLVTGPNVAMSRRGDGSWAGTLLGQPLEVEQRGDLLLGGGFRLRVQTMPAGEVVAEGRWQLAQIRVVVGPNLALVLFDQTSQRFERVPRTGWTSDFELRGNALDAPHALPQTLFALLGTVVPPPKNFDRMLRLKDGHCAANLPCHELSLRR